MTLKDFEKRWIDLIENELIKNFPDEFIELSGNIKIEMPKKALMIGSEFFGNYEIVDSEGNVHFKDNNYYKVKYILYSNRFQPDLILQPKKEEKLVSAVKEYERLLDSILREMKRDYKKLFPDTHNLTKATNRIFSTLNLQRY